MKYILILAASYLLGSIPFGLLVAKWWAKVDVREHGSGNIGMTNVLRTAGYLCAFLTLVGDMGKGIAAVLLGRYFIGDATYSRGSYSLSSFCGGGLGCYLAHCARFLSLYFPCLHCGSCLFTYCTFHL